MPEEKKEAMEPNEAKTPAKGGMKGMFVGIVAVLVLAGVAVGLYQWSGGQSMTAEERTTAMAKKLGETESGSYKLTMTGSLGEEGQAEVSEALSAYGVKSDIANIVLTAEGVSSAKKDEPQQTSLDMKLRGDNANGEEQISLGMSARMIDQLIFMQLHALPEELKSTLKEETGLDISFLEDQWIEVNFQEIAEQLGLPTEDLAALEKGAELTEEERDIITVAFVDHTFLKLSGEGEEEEMQGEATVKYDAQIDVAQLKVFLEELKPIFVARDVTEEEYNKMLESVSEEEYNKMLEDTNLETHVWVGKKDNNLYKMEMMLSPKDEKDAAELKSLTVSYEMWDHNKSLKVETPEDPMSIQEVVGEFIFAAGGAQIEKEAKDAEVNVDAEPTQEEAPAKKEADKKE